jgi:hypothetical protein
MTHFYLPSDGLSSPNDPLGLESDTAESGSSWTAVALAALLIFFLCCAVSLPVGGTLCYVRRLGPFSKRRTKPQSRMMR